MTTSRKSRSSTRNSANPIPLIVAAVVVVGALGIAIATTGGSDEPAVSAYGTPTVSGGPLPGLEGIPDPAVGQAAPMVEAVAVDGGTVRLGEGSQLIAFLAHWCSHCQREVPVVVDWVDAGNLPEGLDLVAVATASDAGQPNFPPQDWLAEEQWSEPIILDSEAGDVAAAYGVSSFPFWVVVHDGEVVARTSGELPAEQLTALADLAVTPAG